MRELNNTAYTLQVISFGLHHGKEHLNAMEPVKHEILKFFLNKLKIGFNDVVIAGFFIINNYLRKLVFLKLLWAHISPTHYLIFLLKVSF